MKMRGKEFIPVYKINEHNEAFYCWQREKYSGRINKPVDLFHVDAHSDMGHPVEFRKSIYLSGQSKKAHDEYYKDFFEKELHIGDFIIPAVLAGLIKDVYFIYPEWRGFKPTHQQMNVCSAFGEGKLIKVGIDLKSSSRPQIVQRAFPDLINFNYYVSPIERTPRNKKVILDIDLDYFACRDSVSNNIQYTVEITRRQFENQAAFLRDRTLPFSNLVFAFLKKGGRFFIDISFKKTKDKSYLPTKEEIESRISFLVASLRERAVTPILITICRSHISGFCPKNYYKFIERCLEKKLAGLFRLGIVS